MSAKFIGVAYSRIATACNIRGGGGGGKDIDTLSSHKKTVSSQVD